MNAYLLFRAEHLQIHDEMTKATCVDSTEPDRAKRSNGSQQDYQQDPHGSKRFVCKPLRNSGQSSNSQSRS
jgi:hypothetical protein